MNSDIAQNNNRLALFLQIITNANYEPTRIEWDGKPKMLKRGDMLTSIAELSFMANASTGTIKRQLEYLIKTNTIKKLSNERGTILSVVNYEKYQHNSDDDLSNDLSNDPAFGIADGRVNEPLSGPVNEPLSGPLSEPLMEELRTNKKELRIKSSHSKNEDENSLEIIDSQKPKKTAAKKKRKTKAVSKNLTKSDGSLVWEAYRLAYHNQYNHEPIRNAKVNSLCSQLVKRIGKSAPEVAAFYVGHRASWYVQKLHMLEYCVKDAEKLYTEFQAGIQMTNKQAQQCDMAQTLDQAGDAYMRNLDKLGLDS